MQKKFLLLWIWKVHLMKFPSFVSFIVIVAGQMCIFFIFFVFVSCLCFYCLPKSSHADKFRLLSPAGCGSCGQLATAPTWSIASTPQCNEWNKTRCSDDDDDYDHLNIFKTISLSIRSRSNPTHEIEWDNLDTTKIFIAVVQKNAKSRIVELLELDNPGMLHVFCQSGGHFICSRRSFDQNDHGFDKPVISNIQWMVSSEAWPMVTMGGFDKQ